MKIKVWVTGSVSSTVSKILMKPVHKDSVVFGILPDVIIHVYKETFMPFEGGHF